MPPALNNPNPVDFRSDAFKPMFEKLQGNIVKGHGRDFSVSIFLELTVEGDDLRKALRWLADSYVTSAYMQLKEAEQYSKLGIPGSLFGNLLLTRHAYRKLGFSADELNEWFADPPEGPDPALPQDVGFLAGMKQARAELGDPDPVGQLEPLEQAYDSDRIDALVILADDSEQFLMREARALLDALEERKMARPLAFEVGRALRTADGEGIEHFGYVDGRSQPLFLVNDFKHLEEGAVVPGITTEAGGESGTTRYWNPFAPLELVLLKDRATSDPDAFGSYFVFRKLEQDVLGFHMAEQQLANALGLQGADRQRAGAMAVGRFRDGSPLGLGETDDGFPEKTNDFRYDGLNATLNATPGAPLDRLGLKCPFQAHIRKTNPRQSVVGLGDGPASIAQNEARDLGRRIARRGITYGRRSATDLGKPQALDDLPSGGVGLLFGCFQSSIMRQFAFMQKTWVNNGHFRVPGTGVDPLIGQGEAASRAQHWRKHYAGEPGQAEPQHLGQVALPLSHPTEFDLHGFIKFRGGEFFFAPSLPFLRGGE